MDDYEKADKKGNRDNIKDFRPWNYYPWLLRVFDINNYFLFCLMLAFWQDLNRALGGKLQW